MNKTLAFIGYSGHSYVCIEAALKNDITISGYYDLIEKAINPYSIKYLGEEKYISAAQKLFISIADNTIRKKIYDDLTTTTTTNFNTILIHPKAIISNTAKIKVQSLICAGVIINAQASVGVGCIVNTGAIVEHECRIGDFSHIAPGAVLLGGVIVGNGSFIGANSVIKQGVSIGKNVLVGAGSVVIKDVLDNMKVAGNPSKII
jgi:sugar O-acyltransferase (sialic acid O-acetyltransferase NeuD family)